MGYRSEVTILIKSKKGLMYSLLDEFFSQSEHSRDTLDKEEEALIRITKFNLVFHEYDIKWYDDPLVDLMDDLVKWCRENKNSIGSFNRVGEGTYEYGGEGSYEFVDDTQTIIWGLE
jgi:hypothetical protein